MTQLAKRPWLLIITHGRFGEELVKSCELVLGKMKDVYCFSLLEGMTPEKLMENVGEVLNNAPEDSLIFTDIFSGTPTNVAAVFAKRHQYTVICGVNLPMLIEAEMNRGDKPTHQLADDLVAAGVGSIINITRITNER